MPKCDKCGQNYCYAKYDLKAGNVKHPELCLFCSYKLTAKELRAGEREKVGKDKKYFKTKGGVKDVNDNDNMEAGEY